jgi:hypothetical protein
LDEHGGKLGAGIVERKPLSVTRQYKIRKEFRKAVDEVVGGAAVLRQMKLLPNRVSLPQNSGY